MRGVVIKFFRMFFLSRVGFLDKLLFTKHLSVMIQSGITTAEALQSLEEQVRPGAWKSVLKQVRSDVENGATLSYAFGKYPKVFDTLYVNLIAIGEESGTLQENLNFLAKQLAKEYALRKKVQGILLYPMIVLTIAFTMSGFISVFILPKLADLFRSFDVTLPLATRILLFIAAVMKAHGIAIFTGIAVAFVLFRLAIKVSFIKPLWHRFLLRLPLLGPFLKNVALAALCRDLGIMLKSGLPITRALQVSQTSMENVVFSRYVAAIQASVARGETISGTLSAGEFPHMPSLVAKMIAVGEKTGKLEDSFLYLGDFFEEEVDDSAKNFSTVLEPVLLLLIGLVVAFVALAIISPIYSLTGSVRR